MTNSKSNSDENRVDETSKESFPASDPPSWTPVSGPIMPEHTAPPREEIYNYAHFSIAQTDLTRFDAWEIGAPIPDMTIMNLNGEPINLAEMEREEQSRIILETGSISCPMFMANNEQMNELADTFLDSKFYIIYTREAHPGETIPNHKTIESKLLNARRLESYVSEHRHILVDHLDGKLHNLLGNMPNSVFVFSGQGILKYRANWNDPDQIKILLSGLTVSEKDAPVDGILTPKLPPLHKSLPVIFDAGHQAVWDIIKTLPSIYAVRRDLMNYMKKSSGQEASLV